ncbi:MAG: RnfABCDGE type electron transport complex subunit G [Alistipes sp.]|nr:RnfABCDGE type electron transport complex subunit G [Alistipes sp.]
MKSSLKNMVLVLFTITAVSALLVGLVDNITKDTIAATELNAKNIAKFEVLNAAESEAVVGEEQVFAIGDFEVVVSTVVSKSDSNIVKGYAVEAPSITRSGYGGRIKLMVGFVEEAGNVTISGVKVLAQSETPGLGANMTQPGNALEKSILKKNPAALTFEVKKKNGSFDSLTGSTISSRAYVNAVETAYAGYLKAKGELDETKVVGADSASGATNSKRAAESEVVEEVAEDVDTASGATTTEECQMENNVTEEEK